jgi:hypothetical protein
MLIRFLINVVIRSSLLLIVTNASGAISDINTIYRQMPSLQGFDICHGGGCAEIKRVALTRNEWLQVTTIFARSPDTEVISADQERKLIAKAIGILESLIGIKTGTNTDRAGTFGNSSFPGQLDCNDEAINTTTYMRLLRQDGLMKLHEIEDTRTRNFFFSGWPHTTAVIHEIASGERFAIDSWFYDNGAPASIVPFSVWKSGYVPTDSPMSHVPSVQKPMNSRDQ